jgi:cytochrome b6-f complex iron-sulfur subunit
MANVDKPRRGFLSRAMMALGGLAVLEGTWVAASFLGSRRRHLADPASSKLLLAGPVDRFAPGSVSPFRDGGFYLVRLEDGGFLALNRKCTHLGCTVPWLADENRFACPCHGSAFDMKGNVLSAPAPRALDLFAVKIESHQVTWS